MARTSPAMTDKASRLKIREPHVAPGGDPHERRDDARARAGEVERAEEEIGEDADPERDHEAADEARDVALDGRLGCERRHLQARAIAPTRGSSAVLRTFLRSRLTRPVS